MKDLSILMLNKKSIDDFSNERNSMLENAKTEWVLFVDTDEIVPKALEKEISEAIKNKTYEGYYIKRKIYFCGTVAGEDKMLKLGKRDAGKWTRKVHEVWDIHGKIGILNNFIIHNTANNLTDYIKKVDYHSTLHAKEVMREGKRSNLIKIIIYSLGNFVVYLFKSKNIVFSIMKSLHSYLSWTKLYFLQHT